MGKSLKGKIGGRKKDTTIELPKVTGDMVVWTFHNIVRAGEFAFDPSRKDFDAEKFLRKLLDFSTMTWARIEVKGLSDQTDALFSFALENIVRVIGIKDGANFQAVWYDARHDFYPADK